MIHTSLLYGNDTFLSCSFNPLNRGGVIHTFTAPHTGMRSSGFNPLNRGGVIHTTKETYMSITTDPGFNPLNRGGVIHTAHSWSVCSRVSEVSILLIEAG